MACKNKKAQDAHVYPGVATDMAEGCKKSPRLEKEATEELNDNHSIGDFDAPVDDPAVPADAL
ncbi:MAG: hypothetical protein K2L21_00200 [Muribaculaceae bacterium]|nr:hypothetical protein [Muribaculaceae bacterium]